MRKKFLLCVGIILLIIGGLFFVEDRKNAFQIEVAVRYSPSRLPLIDIEIDEKLHLVHFDLGSSLGLELKQKQLSEIQAIPDGVQKWGGIDGVRHESRAFKIPKANLAGLVFKNLRVIELTAENENTGLINGTPSNMSICGGLGRKALLKYNLFLDFAHDRFIICRKKQPLINQGILFQEYTKVSFHLDKEGILFRVETDFGPKTFVLDTGATFNVINAELVKQLEWPRNNANTIGIGKSEKLVMGGRDFGKVDLISYDFCGFDKIDGILGMEFLKEHQVFIDFTEKMLYFK